MISCQEVPQKNYYSIKGKIKNFNGTIHLKNAVDNKYYFDNFINDSIIVIDGKFEFRLSRKINYPLPFYIETDKTKTYDFILEPKNQQLIIDSLFYNVSPTIISENSTIQNEQQILEERNSSAIKEFQLEFEKTKTKDFPKDSLEIFGISARKKLTDKSILILKEFTRDYPNSYVAFWKIVTAKMYNGYDIELENAYNNLSNKIKKTSAAKIFEKSMLEARTLQNGTVFPEIKLKNKDLKEVIFNAYENNNSKYILVDFWFSYCGPCISQFPKLNELQKKHNPAGLKIISISTDKTKNVNNWLKVMDNKELTWLNLLDENGINTSALGINTFPTNFLLDKNGVILKKNISLIELEQLLEEND